MCSLENKRRCSEIKDGTSRERTSFRTQCVPSQLRVLCVLRSNNFLLCISQDSRNTHTSPDLIKVMSITIWDQNSKEHVFAPSKNLFEKAEFLLGTLCWVRVALELGFVGWSGLS